MKFLKGLLLVVGVLVLGGWIFWPKGLVVNGPLFDMMTGAQVAAPSAEQVKSRFSVPDGMTLSVFADDVPHARMMRMTKRGDIIVSSMRSGTILLVAADEDGDGFSDGTTTLLSGLDAPHGVAIDDGWLYVGETHQVFRVPFDPATRQVILEKQLILTGIPPGGNHRTRTIGFGPDGYLYVTIGSSCNVCEEDNPFRATMLRMTPQGQEVEIYASGLRNAVGFDWDSNKILFATDNGRDLLGDETPNCELNLIQAGGFYGWPYAYDDAVADPDFGAGNEDKIADSIHPYHGFGAHRAPLGIHFLKEMATPNAYFSDALVALHGSWNHSDLVGYKVVALKFQPDGSIVQEDFMAGFESGGDVIGRPVDVVQNKAGDIFVSDDYAGVIYRISVRGDQVTRAKSAQAQKVDPLQGVSAAELTSAKALGSMLYAVNNCASCHDAAAVGEGVQAKVLTGLSDRYTIKGVEALLKTPPSPMPSFTLSAGQRRALAIYLLDQHP